MSIDPVFSKEKISIGQRLFFPFIHVFHVDGVQFLFTSHYGRFGKVLTTTEFFQHTGSFIFTFEFLEGSFDVFSLFYRHYNHGNKFMKFDN